MVVGTQLKAMKINWEIIRYWLGYLVYLIVGGVLTLIVIFSAGMFLDSCCDAIVFFLFMWPMTLLMILILVFTAPTLVWSQQKAVAKISQKARLWYLIRSVATPLVLSAALFGGSVYLTTPPSNSYMRHYFNSHQLTFNKIAEGINTRKVSTKNLTVLLKNTRLVVDPETGLDEADCQLWTNIGDGLYSDVYSTGFAFSKTAPRSDPPNCSDTVCCADFRIEYISLGNHWYIYSYVKSGTLRDTI